jgi:hypothetical protein
MMIPPDKGVPQYTKRGRRRCSGDGASPSLIVIHHPEGICPACGAAIQLPTAALESAEHCPECKAELHIQLAT